VYKSKKSAGIVSLFFTLIISPTYIYSHFISTNWPFTRWWAILSFIYISFLYLFYVNKKLHNLHILLELMKFQSQKQKVQLQ